MLWEHEPQGECFHSFFEFSQTFTSVCITRQKHEVHVFYFFQKTTRREKGKHLVNFDYQNVNSLCSRHHYVNSARQFCVCIELYNTIFNQSARELSQDCFLKKLINCKLKHPLHFGFKIETKLPEILIKLKEILFFLQIFHLRVS